MMKFNRYSPHRKIIRLPHYNYAQNGLYFITICIQNRECLLGEITNNQVNLNDAGKMVEFWYLELEKHFANVKCLEHIVMPNHIHFIIQIEAGTESNSLFDILYWFKTMTTNEYIRNVKQFGWQPFNKKLWQRSYYEHIIRDEKSYLDIVEYIKNNPYDWQFDSQFY